MVSRSIACCVAAWAVAACSGMPSGGPKAAADLQPTKGNAANGTVLFRQEGSDVVMTATIQGLTPGMHGFHIHEKGDCSAPDATSAGGHFNPTGKPHGPPTGGDHHAGDMPMLVADADGRAKLEARLDGLTIGSGPTDIIGKGVIIHAAPDDFKTQPTGNSGARVACGLIVAR